MDGNLVNGNLAYKLDDTNGNPAYRGDEWREELIDGKVVMMSTPAVAHNYVSRNILYIFFHYLRGKRCTPFSDNTTLFLEEEEHYIPDMMVVCDPDKIRKKGVYGAPDLVVEVLSKSTARNDRGHKKDIYEKHGVREYWIVNPVDLSIEQYVLEDGRFVLRDVYTHVPPADLEDMEPEELAEVVTEFKSTLFDDLTIRLEDVFYCVPSVL